MQVAYSWLRELTGLDWSPEEMGERLLLAGLNCEEIRHTDKYLKNVVVGKVLTLEAVPGASKIRRTTVDIGSETLTLICGAPNAAVGQKVAVAKIGAVMADGMEIKKATIRGVESSGMICSESELGLSEDHSGIMVLPESAAIGKPVADELDLRDAVLSFEITPNRGDALSAIGIARDLAALAEVALRLPEIKLIESKNKIEDQFTVRSNDPIGCPRFTARIIRGITIEQSPWWIRKRLLMSGIRPISNVVDITNFVMLETGNPLHAFDLDRFGSNRLSVRRAHNGQKFTTLDGKEHSLTDDVLLVNSGETPVGVAGVMGGLHSEVADDTKNVLLEVAYFHPVLVRRSRKHLGLNTEASYRFERGVDPNNVERASARAASLMAEICGGELQAGVVDWYPDPIRPRQIALRPQRCRQILGADLPTEKMAGILEHLGFEVESDDALQVTVPTFRSDIEKEIDLIEEVARICGYNNIPDATENKGPLFTPSHPREEFFGQLRHLMTGAGFDEVMGHGLADSRHATLLFPERPQVKITNPVSEEINIMRNTLLVTALTTVSHNIAHRSVDLRLFEIGAAYFPPDSKQDWHEDDKISVAVTGSSSGNWKDHPRAGDFHDLKGALDTIFARIGFGTVSGNPVNYVGRDISFFERGESFEIRLGQNKVGIAGKVTADVLKKFDIKQAVWLAELDITTLMACRKPLTQFTPLPTFPSAPRDLALIVKETVQVGQIIEAVRSETGPLAEAVEVFDIYTGKPIPDKHKSVGITIVYRSPERSLAGEEVELVQQKVVARLKSQFNAELREQ